MPQPITDAITVPVTDDTILSIPADECRTFPSHMPQPWRRRCRVFKLSSVSPYHPLCLADDYRTFTIHPTNQWERTFHFRFLSRNLIHNNYRDAIYHLLRSPAIFCEQLFQRCLSPDIPNTDRPFPEQFGLVLWLPKVNACCISCTNWQYSVVIGFLRHLDIYCTAVLVF